jgi:hypothetical protein
LVGRGVVSAVRLAQRRVVALDRVGLDEPRGVRLDPALGLALPGTTSSTSIPSAAPIIA